MICRINSFIWSSIFSKDHIFDAIASIKIIFFAFLSQNNWVNRNFKKRKASKMLRIMALEIAHNKFRNVIVLFLKFCNIDFIFSWIFFSLHLFCNNLVFARNFPRNFWFERILTETEDSSEILFHGWFFPIYSTN